MIVRYVKLKGWARFFTLIGPLSVFLFASSLGLIDLFPLNVPFPDMGYYTNHVVYSGVMTALFIFIGLNMSAKTNKRQENNPPKPTEPIENLTHDRGSQDNFDDDFFYYR